MKVELVSRETKIRAGSKTMRGIKMKRNGLVLDRVRPRVQSR